LLEGFYLKKKIGDPFLNFSKWKRMFDELGQKKIRFFSYFVDNEKMRKIAFVF